MRWKKLQETEDIISYESGQGKLRIRIEARHVAKQKWDVYKTYHHPSYEDSLIEAYHHIPVIELSDFIAQLKEEKQLDLTTLAHYQKLKKKTLQLDIKREYKEDYVEKWTFRVNGFHQRNFIIVRYDDHLKVDIVLFEQFKYLEKAVVEQLFEKLGFYELALSIEYHVYYFNRKSQSTKDLQQNEDLMVAKVEMEFSDEES